MKEAILKSKWYWYIPIISVIFIKQMASYSIDLIDGSHNAYGMILTLYLSVYQSLCYTILITKIFIL